MAGRPSDRSIVWEQKGTTMDDKATGPELATEAHRWELSDDGLSRQVGARGPKFIAMICSMDGMRPPRSTALSSKSRESSEESGRAATAFKIKAEKRQATA